MESVSTASSAQGFEKTLPRTFRPLARSGWDKLQPLFFNPPLKIAALRLVLLTSFLTSALGSLWFTFLFYGDDQTVVIPVKSIVCVTVLVVTFIHHVMSAFKLKFMIQAFDLVLIVAEIVLLGVYSKFFWFDRWSPQLIIAVVIIIWSLIACLIFLTLCRAATVLQKKGANLFKPFDFLEGSKREKGPVPTNKSPAALSILLGRSIWIERFPGESNLVRFIRGAFSGAFILIMIVYGMFTLTVSPVRETALTPVKEYRVQGTPTDFKLEDPLWHFAFMRPQLEVLTNVSYDQFRAAVKVEPLWDRSNVDAPGCEASDDLEAQIGDVTYQIISLKCPPRNNDTNISSWVQMDLPDVLISIDFTMLGLSVDDGPVLANLWAFAVQVMPGLTSDINFVLRTSTPITMLPNTTHLGELELGIRQFFVHPALSGLGMFESTKTVATARLKSLVPDPLAVFTEDADTGILPLPVGGNQATLRLFIPDAISDITIVQDYREKAVLDGFAVIGGLWTFLCAIFTILFGVSITRILFNTKPISIFGLMQQFERSAIVEGLFEKHPNLRKEVASYQRDQGINSLLIEHLINIDLLKLHLLESTKQEAAINEAKLP
ncbi:hypothetical protein BJ165DRAFT_1496180 [Panaeolus papilionaceus]|nr:hypothetical protein BJ165DRAFT_1496180 [Panaeolus papilionaceus]